MFHRLGRVVCRGKSRRKVGGGDVIYFRRTVKNDLILGVFTGFPTHIFTRQILHGRCTRFACRFSRRFPLCGSGRFRNGRVVYLIAPVCLDAVCLVRCCLFGCYVPVCLRLQTGGRYERSSTCVFLLCIKFIPKTIGCCSVGWGFYLQG